MGLIFLCMYSASTITTVGCCFIGLHFQSSQASPKDELLGIAQDGLLRSSSSSSSSIDTLTSATAQCFRNTLQSEYVTCVVSVKKSARRGLQCRTEWCDGRPVLVPLTVAHNTASKCWGAAYISYLVHVCVWSGYMQGSLEVYWADVALSMETAYSLLLGNTVPPHQYHVFAHLCRFGYIIRRHSNRYVDVHFCHLCFFLRYIYRCSF